MDYNEACQDIRNILYDLEELCQSYESRAQCAEFKYESLLQKYETMERDLNKALSLADLSHEGENTPNPFPT